MSKLYNNLGDITKRLNELSIKNRTSGRVTKLMHDFVTLHKLAFPNGGSSVPQGPDQAERFRVYGAELIESENDLPI